MEEANRTRRPKKRRLLWWTLGILVVSCCPLWLLANWGYERYELWALDRLVDDSKIPGYIAAKDAKNDWPMGTSNGAYVRIHWLVVTEDAQALTDFVEGLALPENVEAGLYDLGSAPGMMSRSGHAVPYDERLFLMTVDTIRDPYDWEVPD
jgi:hypothetical protein